MKKAVSIALLGAALLSSNAAFAKAQGSFTTTTSTSDRYANIKIFTNSGGNCVPSPFHQGYRYYKTFTVTVSEAGLYKLKDSQINVGFDGNLGIYDGPIDITNLATNCVLGMDDNMPTGLTDGVQLEAKTYTLLFTSYKAGETGYSQFTYDGPGTLDVVAIETVPTLTEWAMIILASGLAGAAALTIHRRRRTA